MTIPLRRLLLLCLSATLLTGCPSYSGLSPKATYDDVKDEAIVVMGVAPAYDLQIYNGKDLNGKWVPNTWAASLITRPLGGYLVAKLTPHEGGYGIVGISPGAERSGFFMPCNGDDVLTFEAARGTVYYVGNLQMSGQGEDLRFRLSYDLEAARRHLRAYYPAIADKLAAGSMKFKKVEYHSNNLFKCRADILKKP